MVCSTFISPPLLCVVLIACMGLGVIVVLTLADWVAMAAAPPTPAALLQADIVRPAAISPAATAHRWFCILCIAVLPSPVFFYVANTGVAHPWPGRDRAVT